LCAAIVRLFDEPSACEAFGRAGAARFRSEFTDVRFAARFVPSIQVSSPVSSPVKRPVS
jgi:hypothetical protein